MTFSYTDLFAGIGGFHAALGAAGGEGWFASEIDLAAKKVYEANWGLKVAGDIVPLTEKTMAVPPTDVLAAGFPCQPFSKSGAQLGMTEARGTLFWNILEIVKAHQPSVLLLENVRNLAGPRHRHEWEIIVRDLRNAGYRVSATPAVFSPHLLPPHLGGRPQVRERVFITATYVGTKHSQVDVDPIVYNAPVGNWNPKDWDLDEHLLDDDTTIEGIEKYRLTDAESNWIEVWEDLISSLIDRLDGGKLPGFPIWADEFTHPDILRVAPETPAWKAGFLRKNAEFYARHMDVIDEWLVRHNNLEGIPASRRKLEWQAQDSGSLHDTVMHFRPSGIRAKRATYLPALVAITQTSIIGSRARRITPREAARLQGLPDWFDFSHLVDGQRVPQADSATYKQLGNGVNVGAAYHVFRKHVLRDADLLADRAPDLVEAVLASPENPDDAPSMQQRLEPRPLPVGAQGRDSRVVPLLTR